MIRISQIKQFLLLTVLIFGLASTQKTYAEKQKYEAVCVGFYNLENLFDTIHSPGVLDYEFLPDGANKWNTEKYLHKLKNMAYSIRQIGTDVVKSGPAVLGICEIENRKVVEDLVNTAPLKEMNYGIVHFESNDRRGIDVGLIYQKDKFKVTNSTSTKLVIPTDTAFHTRDQLVVSGELNGEKIHFIVLHWPSRYGGESRSLPLRVAAAGLTRRLADSLMKVDKEAKIVIMGDLNDDPDSPSLTKGLRALTKVEQMGKDDLFNTTFQLYKDGNGSLAYDDRWNLFDQQINSYALMRKDYSSYCHFKTRIFKPEFLVQQEGRYKGYPFRTFAGGLWAGGYADHFPSYQILIRIAK